MSAPHHPLTLSPHHPIPLSPHHLVICPHAACDTPTPPATYALIGVHAGPLALRGLNQNAVSHTWLPAATVGGNSMSNIVRVVEPSNFHCEMSAGGAEPTKLNTVAPSTPSGLPRRSESMLRSLTLSPRPRADTTSITGDSVGGLIDVITSLRGLSPRSIRCWFVIPGNALMMRARS